MRLCHRALSGGTVRAPGPMLHRLDETVDARGLARRESWPFFNMAFLYPPKPYQSSERERERDRERVSVFMEVCVCVYRGQRQVNLREGEDLGVREGEV